MKLFNVCQDILWFLGFAPSQTSQKQFFNRNNLTTFVVCGLCSALTFLFVICDAKVFVEYVEAIYIFSAAFGCTVALSSLRVEMFSKYIFETEKTVASRKSSQWHSVYEHTNRQVEYVSQIICFLGMKVIPLCGVLSLLVPSFFFYFTTGDKSAFMLPVPMWFPFDWRTPLGYLLAVSIQFVIAIYGFAFFGAMLSYGLGAYFFTISLVDDAKNMLRVIQDCAKLRKNQTRMSKQLCGFINFHSDLKQAFTYLTAAYQLVFACLFSWSLITICGALLMVDGLLDHYDEMNSLVLVVMFLEIVCAYGWLLISCELGERFSAKFDEISCVINRFKWYKFPIPVQQMLPTVIIIAQQPITLVVFGSISCLRNSFKKVVNTAFSYFMVLREFSN